MTLSEKVLQLINEIKRERLGSSEIARRARAKLRKTIKGTIVSLTVSDLWKIVKNRKDLLGSEMGEMRTTKLSRVVPNIRAKSITFQGEAYSPGDPKAGIKAKQRKPQATFYSVDFADEKDKNHPLNATLGDGNVKWSEQIKTFKHPVMIRCTCEDFFFRWGYADAKKKTLSGKDNFRYVRKTPPPPLGFPYQNPKNVPGYCKHIHGLLLLLQKRKILI